MTVFPGEYVQAPRSRVEKAYHTLIYFNEADKGGHVAAWPHRWGIGNVQIGDGDMDDRAREVRRLTAEVVHSMVATRIRCVRRSNVCPRTS